MDHGLSCRRRNPAGGLWTENALRGGGLGDVVGFGGGLAECPPWWVALDGDGACSIELRHSC